MEDTVITYTINDLEYIKSQGCDQAWVLNDKRAGACKYLVCCHSQGAKQRNAFLVGIISRIRFVDVDKRSGKNRWAIHISEYATVDIPNMWKGWQNPVHYTTLEDIKINFSNLKFEKIELEEKPEIKEIPPLSIEQAKEAIAKKFEISPDQIEIVIKG